MDFLLDNWSLHAFRYCRRLMDRTMKSCQSRRIRRRKSVFLYYSLFCQVNWCSMVLYGWIFQSNSTSAFSFQGHSSCWVRRQSYKSEMHLRSFCCGASILFMSKPVSRICVLTSNVETFRLREAAKNGQLQQAHFLEVGGTVHQANHFVAHNALTPTGSDHGWPHRVHSVAGQSILSAKLCFEI